MKIKYKKLLNLGMLGIVSSLSATSISLPAILTESVFADEASESVSNAVNIKKGDIISLDVPYGETSYEISGDTEPVIYESSNESVATVRRAGISFSSDGNKISVRIEGKQAGKADIKIYMRGTGSILASYSVTVEGEPENEKPSSTSDIIKTCVNESENITVNYTTEKYYYVYDYDKADAKPPVITEKDTTWTTAQGRTEFHTILDIKFPQEGKYEIDFFDSSGKKISSYTYQVGHHDFDEGVLISEANCLNKAKYRKTCRVCGSQIVEERGELTDHNWSDWEIIVPATETQSGLSQRKCLVCGEVQQRAVDVNGNPVSSTVNIDSSSATINAGNSITLHATSSISNEITWVSSNEEIAVVDEHGTVTGKKEGLVNITAKATDGGQASCRVRVHFDDMKNPDAAFYAPVYWAADNAITTGMENNLFKPDNPCTRGQMVTFLWRVANEPDVSVSENPFKDVDISSTFGKAIIWASERGITTGFNDGTFRQDDPCTRGQIVTFLWRYAGKQASNVDNKFSDVTKDGNAFYDAICWASEHSITTGFDDGTFRQDSTCTRGQGVTFLNRYMNLR